MIPFSKPGAGKARAAILTAAILAAPIACDSAGPEPRGPIDDDTYVAVMSELADLRRFPSRGRDRMSRDAATDSARRAVLDHHGVTVDELLAFAEILGGQPARMVEISERISAVTDSLAELRSRDERDGSAADTAGLETGAAGSDTAADVGPDADNVPAAAPRPIGERRETLRERADRLRGLREDAAP